MIFVRLIAGFSKEQNQEDRNRQPIMRRHQDLVLCGTNNLGGDKHSDDV
jgi:hypothetical protein